MNTLVSVLIAVSAALFAIFHSYPAPPKSPLLYQWEKNDGGSYFIADNYEIFYKDVMGSADSEDILLCLHGFPTSSFDFYLMLPSLRKIFGRIVFLDFLGLGYSDKPRFHTYSIFEQANITEALVARLRLRRVHILAHDLGDTVAQELLARQNEGSLPFQIKTVCLLNGGVLPKHHYPRWSQKLLRMPVVGVVASKLMNHLAFRVALSDVFGPNTKPTATDIHNYWHLARLKDGYRVLGLILSYIDERAEHEDRWVGALQKSAAPVHMIYGPADPVNPPPFQEHYRKEVPSSSIHVLPEHVGHYVQLEAPQEVIAAYLPFLEANGVKTKTISVTIPKRLF
uniref:Putative soluble epoxide hydrolase n=1 Tax=Ixodes ricinus TaxID=34613 RepID=A0A0K8RFU1_IXORI